MTVLVLEHLDESLAALRRTMRWPMAEVCFSILPPPSICLSNRADPNALGPNLFSG